MSIICETVKNGFTNYFGKKFFVTERDSLKFNIISGVGACVFFWFTANVFSVSGYSLCMALIFSVISALANYCTLVSFAIGPMSVASLLVYMGGMLIPSVFGAVYYKQPVTAFQIFGFLLMITSLFFIIKPVRDKSISLKWGVHCVGSFISWGLVGVCQQIHQNSVYADEINEFLFWSFAVMTVIFATVYLLSGRKLKIKGGYKLKSSASLFVLASGLLIAVVYRINLYLSGKMPGVVFFPIVNGGVLLLSEITALIFFKENIGKKGKIGILCGIAAVCLLGI